MPVRANTALAAVGVLAVSGVFAVTTSARAAPQPPREGRAEVHLRLAGYEPKSFIQSNLPHNRGYCTAWVYTRKSGGRWYAKGVVRSYGKLAPHCWMTLDRRHGNGPYKTLETLQAVRETWTTHYYYDGPGYKTRVCVENTDVAGMPWRCGRGV
ncbi:hypothetical protein GCM10010402_08250 [Actinomadura luteofluorescens]|nr:hypothetical protein [Actinomadura glauciflava]